MTPAVRGGARARSPASTSSTRSSARRSAADPRLRRPGPHATSPRSAGRCPTCSGCARSTRRPSGTSRASPRRTTSYRDDPTAWRRVAERWNFSEVNDLIERHNRWYPVEARLPMDPRTQGLREGRRPVLPARAARRRWILGAVPRLASLHWLAAVAHDEHDHDHDTRARPRARARARRGRLASRPRSRLGGGSRSRRSASTATRRSA